MIPTLFATTSPAEPAALDPLVVMMLTVLILGIGVIFIIHTRSRIARRNAAQSSPREQIEEIKHRAEAEGETHRSMSEMLDLSRRLAAQLDTKAQRLEQLLSEAEARIAHLESLPSRGGTAAAKPPSGTGAASGDAGEASLHTEIHRLADAGYSPVEIARRLDEQTGKVELVLALRERAST